MKKAVVSVLFVFLTCSMTACRSTASLSGSSDESSLRQEEALIESGNIAVTEPAEGKTDFASVQYEVGDIVLADGSVVKESNLSRIDSSNVPIAVIVGFQEDGTAFGVGVHRSDAPLQWASDDSAGYAANFTDIACTQKSALDFAGDKDGSDNWDAVCAQDREDTSDSAVNYPAFDFVNTYAETYGLSGDYVYGWYMPSIAELCGIYQNRETINHALEHIYGLDDKAAMNGLGTNWYWSASQSGAQDDYAWFVHYFNGYAGECPKNFTNVQALAVRTF